VTTPARPPARPLATSVAARRPVRPLATTSADADDSDNDDSNSGGIPARPLATTIADDKPGFPSNYITPYMHMIYDHCCTDAWLMRLKASDCSNLERMQGTFSSAYWGTASRDPQQACMDLVLKSYRVRINKHPNIFSLEKNLHCPTCCRKYAYQGSFAKHLATHL
jgi:hypothetical protein